VTANEAMYGYGVLLAMCCSSVPNKDKLGVWLVYAQARLWQRQGGHAVGDRHTVVNVQDPYRLPRDACVDSRLERAGVIGQAVWMSVRKTGQHTACIDKHAPFPSS